jgi:branched-subunit amino acid aminotransferase/4-amino-4-deoxychorismate lyase
MYGYFNGSILPVEQISFGITDLGLLRGFGLFDYFRTYNGDHFSGTGIGNVSRIRRPKCTCRCRSKKMTLTGL